MLLFVILIHQIPWIRIVPCATVWLWWLTFASSLAGTPASCLLLVCNTWTENCQVMNHTSLSCESWEVWESLGFCIQRDVTLKSDLVKNWWFSVFAPLNVLWCDTFPAIWVEAPLVARWSESAEYTTKLLVLELPKGEVEQPVSWPNRTSDQKHPNMQRKDVCEIRFCGCWLSQSRPNLLPVGQLWSAIWDCRCSLLRLAVLEALFAYLLRGACWKDTVAQTTHLEPVLSFMVDRLTIAVWSVQTGSAC